MIKDLVDHQMQAQRCKHIGQVEMESFSVCRTDGSDLFPLKFHVTLYVPSPLSASVLLNAPLLSHPLIHLSSSL